MLERDSILFQKPGDTGEPQRFFEVLYLRAVPADENIFLERTIQEFEPGWKVSDQFPFPDKMPASYREIHPVTS